MSVGQEPNDTAQGGVLTKHINTLSLSDTFTRTLLVVQYHILRDSALATDHEGEVLDRLLSWFKEKSHFTWSWSTDSRTKPWKRRRC